MRTRIEGRPTGWLALLFLVASCSEDSAFAVPDRASLLDLPVGPTLEVDAAWDATSPAECLLFEAGTAALRLSLPTADARVEEVGGMRASYFELPFAAAPLPTPESASVALPGPERERLTSESSLDAATGPSYRLRGRELVVMDPAASERVETLQVTYSVYAAQLWGAVGEFRGAERLTDAARRDVFTSKWSDSAESVEAWVVPAGTRLRVPLPAFDAGTVSLRVRSLCTASTPSSLRASVALAGANEALELSPNTVSEPLRFAVAGGSDMALEVEAEGAPGELLFVEMPHFSAQDAPKRPNVLFVIIDTLRADRLGAYGNKDGLTPHLDRLAEESLRFDQCWSTTSWTLPSTATLLTSSHGGQHRAWMNSMPLGTGIDTLPEVFRKEGYRTAACTAGGFVRRSFGLDRGFLWFDDSSQSVEDTVAFADEFLGAYGDEPWFLFLHTYEVHGPYDPPQPAYDRVVAEHPGALRGLEPDPKLFMEIVAENGGRVPADVATVLEALYDEEVRHADQVLGAFFDRMRADGRFEDTLIVITSDHGEEFGEHGLLGHSDSLYTEQLAVPLLVHLPGGARAGEVDARHVSQIDLAPTVVAGAGFEARLPQTTFAGVSLLGAATASPVYATRQHEKAGLLHAVREGELLRIEGGYRWGRRVKSGHELYDLTQDPLQVENRVREDAARAQALQSRLNELATVYGDSLVEAERHIDLDGGTREELMKLGYLSDDDTSEPEIEAPDGPAGSAGQDSGQDD